MHRIENKMHRSLKFSVRILVDPYIWKIKCILHALLWINQDMDELSHHTVLFECNYLCPCPNPDAGLANIC